MPVFDVVVVGARVAGASLAIRLAQGGLSVALVDKADPSSAPEVPSCPIMYASAVELFDEIGFVEDKYQHAATRIRKGVVGFEGYFQATIPVPKLYGRDYLYGFDRGKFDGALWDHVATVPGITRRAGFTVQDLVRDDADRVVGVLGRDKHGEPERLEARLAVIGADGRHSLIARKAGARVLDDRSVKTSTIHFAEWENVAPGTPDGEPVLQIVSTGRGINVLFFPSSPGRIHVATQVRSDRADIDGDADAYYARHLDSLATVRQRLAGARQIGPVRGVRKIANRYREVGGAGWLLVGDALHHKDPVDGQGIHDALVEGRELAALLIKLHRRQLTWSELLLRYQHAVTAATHAMFEATMKRLERDFYVDPPPLLIRTLLRWALQDPEYQRRFLMFLARAIPPDRFRTPRLMAGVIARGLARDARALLS
ncbi:MAG TPA: FAD-dependent monooxygenase [Kofleriaceae bacterium]|jgi:2-polyprenyl-6-methoxyphenol hydroxylase-like FAD-dependent oxidoreductase